MKYLSGYLEYTNSAVLESKENLLPFIASRSFLSILSAISSPISDAILELHKDGSLKPLTFVDVDYNNNGAVSFVYSYRVLSNAGERGKSDIERIIGGKKENIEESPIWNENRVPISVGRFVRKLFGDTFDANKDIEPFVRAFRAEQKLLSAQSLEQEFELVSGEDIIKYYNEDMYERDLPRSINIGDTTIGGSCMREEHCAEYLHFYAENKSVKMLIHRGKTNGKIDGRAIVWDLSDPSGRTFMDRVYYTTADVLDSYVAYATIRKWLYKEHQNNVYEEFIVDSKTGLPSQKTIRTTHDIKESNNGKYPYLDTLCFFVKDGSFLTNKEEYFTYCTGSTILLRRTDGGYTQCVHRRDSDGTCPDGQIYVESEEVCYDEELVEYCELEDSYFLKDDVVFVDYYGAYVSHDFMEENMIWSNYAESYITRDDSVYVWYADDYVPGDVSVYLYDASKASGPSQSPFPGKYGIEDDIIDVDAHHTKEDIMSNYPHGIIPYRQGQAMYFFYYRKYADYFYIEREIVEGQYGKDGDTERWAFKHKKWDGKEEKRIYNDNNDDV